MNILIVVATPIEIEQDLLKKIQCEKKHTIDVLITGMGVPLTIYQLTKYLFSNNKLSPINLIINIGIAGRYTHDLKNGEVVQVIEDTYADLGFEDHNNFKHISEITDIPLFYRNSTANNLNISKKRGITVNTVTGNEKKRLELIKNYKPDIETMESAAIFDVCGKEKKSFIALRAISNAVGERDISKWDIPLAVHNLWLTLYDFINSLEK